MSFSNVKSIAFYLPQFYRTNENDLWWGRGFTEWQSATTARPLFKGHIQPQLPADLGFHNQTHINTLKAQIDLAKANNLYGFCHYYYWFDGQRLLNKPTEMMLAHKELDMPFCLCWANESWTRRWSGDANDVLVAQNYDQDKYSEFAKSLIPYFSDARYICVDNKPVFLIYRQNEIPNLKKLCQFIRDAAQMAGHSDAYILGAETFIEYGDYKDPRQRGLDGAVEFPPHAARLKPFVLKSRKKKDFKGFVFNANETLFGALTRPRPDYPLYRTVFPAWDNTARRKYAANIFLGTSPLWFSEWLYAMAKWTVNYHQPAHQFLFINAWNEWAEGAQIEPDLIYGQERLNRLKSVLSGTYQAQLDYHPKDVNRPEAALDMEVMAKYKNQISALFPLKGFIPNNLKVLDNDHPIYDSKAWAYPFTLHMNESFPFFSNLVKVRTMTQLRRVIGTCLRVEIPTKKSHIFRNKLFDYIYKARRRGQK